MQIAVVGSGAVGSRAARQLASTDGVEVLVDDPDLGRVGRTLAAIGDRARRLADGDRPDAVVVASPTGTQVDHARRWLADGVAVVTTGDDVADVQALLDLDAEAAERGVPVVVASGFAPGVSCLLAAHAAATFDHVDEIHVARVGTGGPSCARQHHAALRGVSLDWRDGAWQRRQAGSGRELCWFPDPVGGRDCYRAALPDPLLLVPAFPGVERVTSRLAANRRDRLTAGLPMLRPPHAEGGPGAIRVELRGDRAGGRAVLVYGAMELPAVAAGATAAAVAIAVAGGRVRRAGAGGAAALLEPLPILRDLAERGVRAAAFDGG